MGYPTLGTYRNHQVTKILHDPVIFLSNLECTFIEGDKRFQILLGMGYYYSTFQIGDKPHISDQKRLTGIVFEDFVYQYLQKSKNITMLTEPDIILKEDIYSIPLNLNHYSLQKRNFIKGLVNRHAFLPYGQIWKDVVHHFKTVEEDKFHTAKHSLLLATRDHFNTITISDSIPTSIQEMQLEATPGISKNDQFAEKTIQQFFSQEELEYIKIKIQNLEQTFEKCEFNPLEPYGYFEQGGKSLQTAFTPKNEHDSIHLVENSMINQQELNPGIFVTSSPFDQDIVWPKELARNTKDSWGTQISEPFVHPIAMAEQNFDQMQRQTGYDLKKYARGPTENHNQFELKISKRPQVSRKKLPEMPSDTIYDILIHLKYLIAGDYEKRAIGNAIADARDKIREISRHFPYIMELSHLSNSFKKERSGFGLNSREKEQSLTKIHEWITEIEKRKELEEQRLEEEKRERQALEEKQKRQKQLRKQMQETERLLQDQIKLENGERKQTETEQFQKEIETHLALEQEKLRQEEEERIAREKRLQEQVKLKEDAKHLHKKKHKLFHKQLLREKETLKKLETDTPTITPATPLETENFSLDINKAPKSSVKPDDATIDVNKIEPPLPPTRVNETVSIKPDLSQKPAFIPPLKRESDHLTEDVSTNQIKTPYVEPIKEVIEPGATEIERVIASTKQDLPLDEKVSQKLSETEKESSEPVKESMSHAPATPAEPISLLDQLNARIESLISEIGILTQKKLKLDISVPSDRENRKLWQKQRKESDKQIKQKKKALKQLLSKQKKEQKKANRKRK